MISVRLPVTDTFRIFKIAKEGNKLMNINLDKLFEDYTTSTAMAYHWKKKNSTSSAFFFNFGKSLAFSRIIHDNEFQSAYQLWLFERAWKLEYLICKNKEFCLMSNGSIVGLIRMLNEVETVISNTPGLNEKYFAWQKAKEKESET